jgi:prefoldin subunit 5
MTTPRRRVLRSTRAAATVVDPRQEQRLHRRRQQLQQERATLDRWMAKLKRAFHAVEKAQARINRLERQVPSSEAS